MPTTTELRKGTEFADFKRTTGIESGKGKLVVDKGNGTAVVVRDGIQVVYVVGRKNVQAVQGAAKEVKNQK
jgi:hypothetical protein